MGQTIGIIGGWAFLVFAFLGLVVTAARALWARASARHLAALQNHEQRVVGLEQRVANQERLLLALQPKPEPAAATPKKKT